MKKIFASLLAFSAVFLVACGERDVTLDPFAQCIADSGTTFYGAFWCPHCNEQKEAFGDSVDLLPYVECAQGGKDAQPELCEAEGVDRYPTWKFPNGTVTTGVLSFETLAEQTSCPLPGNETILR